MSLDKIITQEQNNKILKYIEKEIKSRKLKWCSDTDQFIQGLLLGMEAGLKAMTDQLDESDKYNKTDSEEE